VPEAAVVVASWLFHDAGRCGEGNSEQQEQCDEMAHYGCPSEMG
jgi:hypothetical protein